MTISSWRPAVAAAITVTSLIFAAPAYAGSDHGRPRKDFDLQAHRGGLGLRVEGTLAAFGNALTLGVSTLELDVLITEDGEAVVSHDRRVQAGKCADTAPVSPGDPEFPYVNKLIKDLSLAQIRTLDCGSATLPDKPGQLAVPGSRMPLLREVFDLVKRYQADDVSLNVETKVEASSPQETAPREQFVQVVAREIRDAGFERRVTVQSFDWGVLMRLREVAPTVKRVALGNNAAALAGVDLTPWLGGLDLDDFGGDPIAAVKTFGAYAYSPLHGYPENAAVTDPGYLPFVDKALVDHAHRNGIKVIPWTVDDVPTMAKLIDDGVDGIITDYPDRLRGLLDDRGYRLPRAYPSPFDVQAHRGARSARPENTLAAFRYALANPDVSTLELDTGVTKDGHLVVSHDRVVNGSHCVDTAPARRNDPKFPYVDKALHDLTLAQVRTIDCGSKTLPEFPGQQSVPGERIPTLEEVFDLVRTSGRKDIRLNIETRTNPLVADTAPYQIFTGKLVRAIQASKFTTRATIQSLDWRTIRLARKLDPRIETVAIVRQYGPAECTSLADACSLRPVYGDPSVTSPWTGGLDWWRYRDLGKLVRAAGASTVSSNWQVHDPDQATVDSPDWFLRQNPSYYHGPAVGVLRDRHRLKVIPYTIDDEATMQRVIDLGADGIISDDVDLLARVARRNGLR
ncbi:glycerophosphodiester phosphodiesterase family protein [Acrocarpospora sp. B8E8]|uniref:glycerophosphodiester phosphodiesterase family protein n=1 Tax=Acrocarpospora sp. B8E8 TaxID=3153572 RepID=UPI00325E0CE8